MLAKLKALFQPTTGAAQHSERQLQLAAAALLIELARADYLDDQREQQAIVEAVRATFELDVDTVAELVEEARLHASDATSLYEFTSQINQHFGEPEKIELVRQLWRVAYADGSLDKYEDHLIRKVAELLYVSHWVTPVGETKRRFDTRFFLAAAPQGQEGRHDDAELVDSRWVAPADALAAGERRELMLMPPTESNLRLIADCSSVAEALARADAVGPPPRIEPKIRRGPDGKMIGIILPDDPDYD